MTRATSDPSARRPRGPEDTWVEGPQGRYWGTFGAAGLLLAHPEAGVLLQLRAIWSHLGGTWGLPGGARKAEETPEAAALREADEEAGVPPHLVTVLGTSVLDLGYWSYTTVLARADELFTPVIGDAESDALRWVPFDDVGGLPLHPGFARGWPGLRLRLDELLTG
ncbi:MAG TPA: NUDIX domain-containing protein [Nocardioidaceae bacterium]|jgi:8-oxo-dGTP pyrophosphatase MutT (NUDIX family)|nr:NUDIX domain-containing protein [Nocardioidaceae bacterium]